MDDEVDVVVKWTPEVVISEVAGGVKWTRVNPYGFIPFVILELEAPGT